MDKLTGRGGAPDCPPTKASQVIVDKIEHLIVRANNLASTAGGLSTFMLGPKAAAPQVEAEKKAGSFAEEVLRRLEDLGNTIGEAQGYLDELRSQF